MLTDDAHCQFIQHYDYYIIDNKSFLSLDAFEIISSKERKKLLECSFEVTSS